MTINLEATVSANIERLHSLPDTALFTAEEAGHYLNARMDLLRSWRWQGRGPAFCGRGHFIRYPKGELDRFLAGYERGRGEAAADGRFSATHELDVSIS